MIMQYWHLAAINGAHKLWNWCDWSVIQPIWW